MADKLDPKEVVTFEELLVNKLIEQETEYNDIMEKLKQACNEDKTGKYRGILEQSREGKVVH